jgi:hypothetical protein
MKTTTLLSFLLIALGFNSYSQNVERLAITSGGGFAKSAFGETVQFTIGQSYFTQTLSDGNANYLTQGFEQPANQNLASIDAANSAASIEIYANKIEAFPNPAVNFTNVVLSLIDDDGAKVSIIDMWGQPLKKENFTVTQGKQQLHFVFGNVPAGLYTLSVEANKKVYNKKLLIAGTNSTVSL